MPIIKRLLLAKVLPITKDTPYVKALKVAALIFMLPEALIIATLPFEVFSPNEVALISLFFLWTCAGYAACDAFERKEAGGIVVDVYSFMCFDSGFAECWRCLLCQTSCVSLFRRS